MKAVLFACLVMKPEFMDGDVAQAMSNSTIGNVMLSTKRFQPFLSAHLTGDGLALSMSTSSRRVAILLRPQVDSHQSSVLDESRVALSLSACLSCPRGSVPNGLLLHNALIMQTSECEPTMHRPFGLHIQRCPAWLRLPAKIPETTSKTAMVVEVVISWQCGACRGS